MNLDFRIVGSPQEWQLLQPAWDELVKRQAGSILGIDVTSTYMWATTLWSNHLNQAGMEVLIAESGGKLQALMPLFRGTKTIHSLRCRTLSPVTELYSGRCGFLLAEPRAELLKALLDALRAELPDWDVFVFTLVKDSVSEKLLEPCLGQQELRIENIANQKSPYIALDRPWEEYFASLPRKFRWNLKNFEKKMNSSGAVVHRVYEHGSDLEQFRLAVQEIEKGSWKEGAGTSMTANLIQETFHASLMHPAAQAGFFSGHVLEFRGEPVSYVWGLVFENIFYDFKESYKSAYRDFGPGHVLKFSLMQQLFSRRIAFFDYMGACEEYKLRWTDKTYERVTYALYNKTLRAKAAALAGKIRRRIAPEPSSSASKASVSEE